MRKQGIFRRAAAVFLALALMAGAMPAAFAAGAEDTIKEANEKNNFDYVYFTSPETVTADSNGIVTATFTKPETTTTGDTAKSGAFYAAILPEGKNDADDVRYVRLTEEGNQLNLTYFRDGYSKFQVMLVQPLPDGGDAAISSAPSSVTHYTANGSSHTYTVNFKATLKMSQALAQIADLNKDDTEKMNQLTFTAHIRLPDELKVDKDSLELHSDIFTFTKDSSSVTEDPGSENGYDVKCTLKNDWEDTSSGKWASLVNKLQKEMSFTGTATITGADIQRLVNAGQGALYLVGWNSIEGIPTNALSGTQIQVPAVTYALPIRVVDNSGGGGGGGATLYPITVEESDHGSADSSHDRAAQGTRVTITVEAEDGYRLGELIVVDKNGDRIDVTNAGGGKYTFRMPASAVTVTPVFVAAVADPDQTGVSGWLNDTDHDAYLTGYPDETFGPDRNMTRAEVAQMFYGLLRDKDVEITVHFDDVPADAWYATAVNALASLGMVSGVGGNLYDPGRSITRAEFATIAMAFAQRPDAGRSTFADVAAGDWFHDYVVSATYYGWVGGYPDGTFRPHNTITRAEVTTIVNNMLNRAADVDYVDDHRDELRDFTDLTDQHWGFYQIMEATNSHDYTRSGWRESWR